MARKRKVTTSLRVSNVVVMATIIASEFLMGNGWNLGYIWAAILAAYLLSTYLGWRDDRRQARAEAVWAEYDEYEERRAREDQEDALLEASDQSAVEAKCWKPPGNYSPEQLAKHQEKFPDCLLCKPPMEGV